MSCPPGGGCLVAGFRATSSGGRQPFLSILKDGRWSRARPVPGLAALPGGFASGQPAWAGCTAAGDCDVIGTYTTRAVACPSPGNCSAGGTFTAPKTAEVFTVDEKNGTWSTSKELPGSVALNRGGDADIAAMACAAPGDCAAAGFYSPVNQRFDPLIATETNGTWGKAEKVPGLP